MANTVIKLRKSSVPSEIPSSLEYGELAINYADGKFYYKNSTGQIVSFSGAANVYSFATINANNSLITALSNNSILTINPGDNIAITGDIINDIVTIAANLKPVFDIANAAFATANTAAGYGQFPVGDYSEGEPVLGQSESFDPFGVSLVVGFDCNDVGAIRYSNLGLL